MDEHVVSEDNAGRESWRVELMEHPAVLDAPLRTRVVWLALLHRMHNDGWCIPRLRWLVATTGLHPQSTRRAMHDLEARGLVTRKPRYQRSGRQTTNHVSLGPVARGRVGVAPTEDSIPLVDAFALMHRDATEAPGFDR